MKPNQINKTVLRASAFAQPFNQRYGPGGRHSISGITATVFGSYGFLGKYVCSTLGARGSTCFAPFRGDEMEVRPLKQMFDLGNLALIPFSPRHVPTIQDSVKRSNIVINLIGKDRPTHNLTGNVNYSLKETLVDIPQRIARTAKINGVEAFIHVSALSADPNACSEWSQLKYEGELAVRREFPEAIIVRPSTMFGHEDKFLNRIAWGLEHAPFIPMINNGANKIQPVNVIDVADAINLIINGWKDFQGKTFELAGPEVYSTRELVEFVADITSRPAFMIGVPDIFWELLSRTPPFYDQYQRIIDNSVLIDDGTQLTFADLGMTPTSIETEAFDFLYQYRPGGHFREVEGYYSTEQERLLKDAVK